MFSVTTKSSRTIRKSPPTPTKWLGVNLLNISPFYIFVNFLKFLERRCRTPSKGVWNWPGKCIENTCLMSCSALIWFGSKSWTPVIACFFAFSLDQLFDLLINRQTNRVTTAKITFAISDIFYYDPDSDLRTLLGILTDGLKDNLRKLQIQQARCDRLG